ncbi:MAG TPA: type II toxin-antitoxin system VapC family toxin [Mucilaginibacter sp.]
MDTHCLIWFQENNPKLPQQVLEIIEDPDNIILFSQISLFELSIKLKIGKIPDLQVSIETICTQAVKDGFTFMDIQNSHIYTYQNVPLFENHRDPFDRLLIAVAMEEKAILLSADEKFKLYQEFIEVMW